MMRGLYLAALLLASLYSTEGFVTPRRATKNTKVALFAKPEKVPSIRQTFNKWKKRVLLPVTIVTLGTGANFALPQKVEAVFDRRQPDSSTPEDNLFVWVNDLKDKRAKALMSEKEDFLTEQNELRLEGKIDEAAKLANEFKRKRNIGKLTTAIKLCKAKVYCLERGISLDSNEGKRLIIIAEYGPNADPNFCYGSPQYRDKQKLESATKGEAFRAQLEQEREEMKDKLLPELEAAREELETAKLALDSFLDPSGESAKAAEAAQAQRLKEKAKKDKEDAKAAAKEAKESKKREKAEGKAAAKKAKEDSKVEKAATVAAGLATVSSAATLQTGEAVNELAESLTQTPVTSVDTHDEGVHSSSLEKDSVLDVTPQAQKKIEKGKIELNKKPAMSTIKVVGGAVLAGTAATGGYIVWKQKSDKDEKSRMEQYKMILGVDEDDPTDSPFPSAGAGVNSLYDSLKDIDVTSSLGEEIEVNNTPIVTSEPSKPVAEKKKKKKGIKSIFSKKDANARETDLDNLISTTSLAPKFCTLLSQILALGSPGRFPDVEAIPGGPKEFILDEAKASLSDVRDSEGLTPVLAAESFACVVNCMIIDIIDLASSTLKEKEDKITVDALNVVLDFMDHAASLYDAVADGVAITPVTYGGTLGKGKLEQMYTKYLGTGMSFEEGHQDRVDTLQQVFKISDKKAQGISQKVMMKNLMKMMKGDGEGMEGMMPEMEEMMKAMGDMGMGMGDDFNPEDVKASVDMMKSLIESGQLSDDDIEAIKQDFKNTHGADIDELLSQAEGMDDIDSELGPEGKELLELFKSIMKK